MDRRALLVAVCLVLLLPAMASAGEVQALEGRVLEEGGVIYLLPDLQPGETVTVRVNRTSGNLDPFVAIAPPETNRTTLGEEFWTTVESRVRGGGEPVAEITGVADQFFLAWDDDSAEGHAAAFSWEVPEAGDYPLIITSSPLTRTFGEYGLLVGIDAPGVLNGTAEPTPGAVVAVPDPTMPPAGKGVEERTGTLTANRNWTFFPLKDLEAEDTIHAVVETISGDLKPVLILESVDGKPLMAANFLDHGTRAALSYQVPTDETEGLVLHVEAGEGEGEFRLLVGVNDPGVLDGTAVPGGRQVIRDPITVRAAVELDQITGVDQKAENYAAVANIRMRWTDPELAFDPQEEGSAFKIYREIDDFVEAEGTRWPEFTLFNQQGNRWTQNRLITITPDGTTTYFERFWTTFQAPDFYFKDYPFDTQTFYIRIQALYPEEFFQYADWEGKTVVGTQLGEEEWYITNYWTEVDTVEQDRIHSRFSFGFDAQRHLEYYILRIFVPIFILVMLGWVTFLLKDYSKRADVASANLLLFIAFNFTIAGDLPRLGYLTFLDAVLITTFVVSGLTVVYNLYLKWLATKEQKEVAERLDRVLVWCYPVAYIVSIVLITTVFS
ncbi:hypothetical protein [Methanofollis formosanus]|nr:hypothetical protein [Methanofollis formosanus]